MRHGPHRHITNQVGPQIQNAGPTYKLQNTKIMTKYERQNAKASGEGGYDPDGPTFIVCWER